MNDIWKLHSVLNEEDGDVVANDVPIALFGVELDGETADIADSISGTTATEHSREAQEHGCLARCVGEHAGGRDVGCRFEEGELSKRARTTGVDDALGDALVVEALNLHVLISCCYLKM